MNKLKFIFVVALCIFFEVAYAQNDSKQELKKLADDITQQINQKGNQRIAVANFTDQQNNVTELGKFLSQQFIVNLIRNGLDVVDRSRIEDLMEENKMSAKGLLDPKNQAKLGQLAGIEAIVVGTTTPSDKSVELVITVLDIARGSGIAGTDGSITRTNSMNDLLRSNVKDGGGESAVQRTPTVNISDSNKINNLSEVLMGDKVLPMQKQDCYNESGYQNFGQLCFENSLSKSLFIYAGINENGSRFDMSLMIGKGARNCNGRFWTGQIFQSPEYFKATRSSNYTLYFHTTEPNEEERSYGSMTVLIEGCKSITRVINENRLFLSRTKPK
jgi:TolB-like protein